MTMYESTSKDGRFILSNKNLDYARMATSLAIDLGKVRATDKDEMYIIPDTFVGRAIVQLLKSKAAYRNIKAVTIVDGNLCIRDGKEYVTIDRFLSYASKGELQIALIQIASQLAEAELSNEVHEPVVDTEKKGIL